MARNKSKKKIKTVYFEHFSLSIRYLLWPNSGSPGYDTAEDQSIIIVYLFRFSITNFKLEEKSTFAEHSQARA